jgi:hypothetical protein
MIISDGYNGTQAVLKIAVKMKKVNALGCFAC